MSAIPTSSASQYHHTDDRNWFAEFVDYALPQRSENFVLITIIIDALCVLAALTVAGFATGYAVSQQLPLPYAVGVYGSAAFVWFISFLCLSLYNPDARHSTLEESNRVVIGATLALFAWVGLLSQFALALPQYTLIAMYVGILVSTLGWRLVVFAKSMLGVLRATTRRQRILIIGTNDNGEALARLAERDVLLNKKVVGFIGNYAFDKFSGYNVLGSLEADIFKLIRIHEIDEIVVALPAAAFNSKMRVMKALPHAAIPVSILPQHVNMGVKALGVVNWSDVPLVDMFHQPIGGYGRLLKRTFDVAVATVALILALPIMMIVALAIRLDSRGGIFFMQERMGYGGHSFKIFKFRSMVANADRMVDAVKVVGEDGKTLYKLSNDMRVTSVGKIIRKTSLDELPQLLNVIRGDMSLVGPRPETLRIVETEYETWQHQRFRVIQGITGWWQVNGRSENECYRSTDQDLYYIENYSFWLDLKVLLMTIPAILRGKGAI